MAMDAAVAARLDLLTDPVLTNAEIARRELGMALDLIGEVPGAADCLGAALDAVEQIVTARKRQLS